MLSKQFVHGVDVTGARISMSVFSRSDKSGHFAHGSEVRGSHISKPIFSTFECYLQIFGAT